MPDKHDFDLVNPIVRRWQRDAEADPEGFWAAAAQELPWFKPWDRVFEWQPPTFSWFLGAETNLAYNCLDHHVRQGNGGRAAFAQRPGIAGGFLGADYLAVDIAYPSALISIDKGSQKASRDEQWFSIFAY